MARNQIKIDSPQTLSIANEIHQTMQIFEDEKERILARVDDELRALVDANNKLLHENFERLRHALNLTAMIEPALNVDYLHLGVAILEHGIHEGTSKSALIEKQILGSTEH